MVNVKLQSGQQAVVTCAGGTLSGALSDVVCNGDTTTTTAAPSTTTTVASATTTTVPVVSGFKTVGALSSSDSNSLSVSDTTSGDLRVVWVSDTGAKDTIGLSGGGVSTWNSFPPRYRTSNTGTIQLFWGVVSSTGSKALTVSTPSGGIEELYSQEFSDGSGVTYAADKGGSAGGTSSTFNYPSLVPASSGELFFGYAGGPGAVGVGSTPGFAYTTTGDSNDVVWSLSGPSPSAPAANDSNNGWDAVDGLIMASPSGGSPATTIAPTTTTTGAMTTTTGPTTTIPAPTSTTTQPTSTTTTTHATTTTTQPTTTTGATSPSGGTCTNPTWSSSNPEDSTSFGNFLVNNDAWSGGAGPQTIYACNYNSWYVVSNQTNQQGAVETYPDTEYDLVSAPYACSMPNCGPVISSLSSVSSNFGIVLPAGTNIGYDAAYDTWVDGLNENNSDELMVWNKWENDLNGYSPTVSNVVIGGTSYDVYEQGLPGSGGAGLTIFAMNNQEASGTVDLLSIYNWVIANHPNWFDCSSTAACQAGGSNPAELSSVEYGVEISYTDGSQDFGVNNFSLSENGTAVG